MSIDSGLDAGSVVQLHYKNFHRECHLESVCPTCDQPARVTRVKGEWDNVNERTRMPFEPVWAQLSCGCTFGDESRAEPTLF